MIGDMMEEKKKDYITIEENRFIVHGKKGRLIVGKHKSKNFGMFIIGVENDMIKVGLHFALLDEDAKMLAEWILSKIKEKSSS